MKEPPLKHIAIIMDGNRRWAKERGLPVVAGHKKVVAERIEELIEHAAECGIPYITFWAFSTENWQREQQEVAGIMKLFMWALKYKTGKLITQGAKVKMIGDLSKFNPEIQKGFQNLMAKTAKNQRITVIFALNYGGRDEILRAIEKMRQSFDYAQDKKLSLDNFLDTAGIPDPDMIIRTGGEQRLSGFMLWQSEYSELYFTKTLMPEFGAKELDKALDDYGQRQRRRGK